MITAAIIKFKQLCGMHAVSGTTPGGIGSMEYKNVTLRIHGDGGDFTKIHALG